MNDHDQFDIGKSLAQADRVFEVDAPRLAKSVLDESNRRRVLIGRGITLSCLLAAIGLTIFFNSISTQNQSEIPLDRVAEHTNEPLDTANPSEEFASAVEWKAESNRRILELQTQIAQLESIRERQQMKIIRERLSRVEIEVPKVSMVEF